MNKIITPKFNGYAVSNLLAFVLIGLSKLLLDMRGLNAGIFVFSEFVIVPFLMGIISTWYWKNLQLTGRQLTGYSCINGLIAIALSYIFLKEGSICLLIVSPLLLAFIISGAFAGRAMFRQDNETLNVSVLSLLLLVFVVDSISLHEYKNEVSDQIIINAPVSKVWPLVVEYDRNTDPDKYWLFKAGMPSPVQSTVDGHYVGANRKCIFSNGYTFDEKIVTYDINQNLTFDITRQPRDPEIMGHIDIIRGQFILKDNHNGTTTLIGNSWYKLYVFPTWYYDWWAESITRNVHLRVMDHIKHLSEKK
ncbi:SRPBCC family protein [Mucilaginibacter aquatilis]|nr:hypothetical protein [Mucilaginibacter aquatilis]